MIDRFISQGILTEELAMEFVNTSSLPDLEKLTISLGLDLDKQFSHRNSLEQQYSTGTCQEAMTAQKSKKVKKIILLSDKEQSRELDRRAESWNLTGEALMENAGRLSAQEALSLFPRHFFLIFCGSGNNGGDGWVMARHLKESGKSVAVFLQTV